MDDWKQEVPVVVKMETELNVYVSFYSGCILVYIFADPVVTNTGLK